MDAFHFFSCFCWTRVGWIHENAFWFVCACLCVSVCACVTTCYYSNTLKFLQFPDNVFCCKATLKLFAVEDKHVKHVIISV